MAVDLPLPAWKEKTYNNVQSRITLLIYAICTHQTADPINTTSGFQPCAKFGYWTIEQPLESLYVSRFDLIFAAIDGVKDEISQTTVMPLQLA